METPNETQEITPVETAGIVSVSEQEDIKRRSTRSAAKQAGEILKTIMEEDEGQVAPKEKTKKNKKVTFDVPVLGGLFNCEYQSEDTDLIEDDLADVKHLFVNAVFNVDFAGIITKGQKFAAIAIDFNRARMELWHAETDERVHVIDFTIGSATVLPESEWPPEVLAASDEESDVSFEDDYDSDEYDSDEHSIMTDEITESEEEEDDFTEESESESELSSSSESASSHEKTRKRKSFKSHHKSSSSSHKKHKH